MTGRRTLLISDDSTFRYHAARELTARGLRIATPSGLDDAVSLALDGEVDAIVIEATLPRAHSLVAIVDRLREQSSLMDVPIAVCLSDAAMLDAHSMYLALRGCSVPGRPFNPDGLAAALVTQRAVEPLDAVVPRSPAWS